VVPAATELLAGVTAIETKVGVVTLTKPVEPVTDPCCAEIIVDSPVVTPVARPVALMVTALVLDDAQVTEFVKSWVVLFEKAPVALN
jgi:hypothetical protein